MKKLAKNDLLNELASRTGSTKVACEAHLDALAKILAEKTLDEGIAIPVQGIGLFKPVEKAAREGRNPATGEPVQIPASKTVGFKVSEALKRIS